MNVDDYSMFIVYHVPSFATVINTVEYTLDSNANPYCIRVYDGVNPDAVVLGEIFYEDIAEIFRTINLPWEDSYLMIFINYGQTKKGLYKPHFTNEELIEMFITAFERNNNTRMFKL